MYEFLKYRVHDAMTPDPVTITADTLIRDLEALFEVHDFNGVPVVGGGGQLLGIATKFDILKAFTLTPGNIVPRYEEIMAKSVDGVMTRDVITVSPEMPLSRLLQRLVDLRSKSLPVVSEGRLVGMIAREDVLQALRRATDSGRPREEDTQ